MIIVTGTKRSGTSMWMQVLRAAGFPTLGEAFPRDWARTIRTANPEGFFESPLRTGVYHATNPNPRTGDYLAPAETRRTAVKVFVPGLVRSDLAFVDHVVATMRSLREYVSSLERLYRMERESKARIALERGREPLPSLEPMQPGLEWWHDNYRLLCDSRMRRYPLRLTSYASVLAQPERAVRRALDWLGLGDPDRAVAEVRVHMRTQRENQLRDVPTGLSRDVEAVCDELYARIHEEQPLDTRFCEKLNATHSALAPLIKLAEARAKESRRRVRALREAQRRKAKL